MNENEIDRIAAAMHQLRPDWPVKSLRTMLNDPQLRDRPRRDVCVALAWVACETNTHTPARVLEAGPWWRAAAVEGNSSHRDNPEPHERCGVCSLSESRCRSVWGSDHEFEPATLNRRLPADAVADITSELRDRLERTKPRPEPAVEARLNPEAP